MKMLEPLASGQCHLSSVANFVRRGPKTTKQTLAFTASNVKLRGWCGRVKEDVGQAASVMFHPLPIWLKLSVSARFSDCGQGFRTIARSATQAFGQVFCQAALR